MASKNRVRLHPVEDVQPTVQILPNIVLIFPEVKVKCMKDDPYGNVSVESRYKEPSAQVIAWDVAGDTIPHFRRGAVGCWFIDEVDLERSCAEHSLGREAWCTCHIASSQIPL